MRPWTPPVARPKFRKEYACYPLTEVPPLAPWILTSYAKYSSRKDALMEEISAQTDKVKERKAAIPNRAGVYRVQAAKDVLLDEKNSKLAKETAELMKLNARLDTLTKDNRLLEDIISLQTKMEESYESTKVLQEESRRSWAQLYS